MFSLYLSLFFWFKLATRLLRVLETFYVWVPVFSTAMRPRNEYAREQGSPLCASFPSIDQFSVICEGPMVVTAISTHAQKHWCCCCLAGVQFPIGEHSTANSKTGVLPTAVRGSPELLARSKGQISSDAPYISNIHSMQSCWEKSASVGVQYHTF